MFINSLPNDHSIRNLSISALTLCSTAFQTIIIIIVNKIHLCYYSLLQFHSEYRSTYRWHEYTGGSRPEVIRKPPVTNQFGEYADNLFITFHDSSILYPFREFGEYRLVWLYSVWHQKRYSDTHRLIKIDIQDGHGRSIIIHFNI